MTSNSTCRQRSLRLTDFSAITRHRISLKTASCGFISASCVIRQIISLASATVISIWRSGVKVAARMSTTHISYQFGFVFGCLLNLPNRLSGGAIASQSRLKRDFQFFAPDEMAESDSAPVHRSFRSDPAGSKTCAETAE